MNHVSDSVEAIRAPGGHRVYQVIAAPETGEIAQQAAAGLARVDA